MGVAQSLRRQRQLEVPEPGELAMLGGAEMALDATSFPFVTLCSTQRGNLHCTHLVAAPRGAVNMVPLGHVPIPWSSLLGSFERHVLTPPCFQPTCNTPVCFRSRGYGGDSMLVLHCHCSNPYSLQCWARSAWLRTLIQRYVASMEWNARFPMYRGVVNSRLATEYMMYLGSAFVPQGHFIYVAVRTAVHVARLARVAQDEPTSFGLPFLFFIDTTGRNNTLVLKCRLCVEHGQSWTGCAERTARVLQRMCRAIGAEHEECGYQYGGERSHTDVYRHDRAVERYHRYNIPIPQYRAFYPYFYITRHFDSSSEEEVSEDSDFDE